MVATVDAACGLPVHAGSNSGDMAFRGACTTLTAYGYKGRFYVDLRYDFCHCKPLDSVQPQEALAPVFRGIKIGQIPVPPSGNEFP